MCNIHRNRWCITQGTQLERRLLRLKSCCYNKSCADPPLSDCPRCDDQKPFLNCFRSLLDSPKYSLAWVYHRPIPWRFCKRLPFALVELVYRWFQASTQHGVGPLRAMSSWSHSFLHVSALFSYRRECHLWSRWGSIQFGSSYPDGWCHPRRWNLRKFFFLSEHPLKSLDQEDRVMKPKTSRAMKHNLIR
jgi:hypothetical protein